MVPSKMFFTKGVGVAKQQLMSFEMALRNAGIEKLNLVSVSRLVRMSLCLTHAMLLVSVDMLCGVRVVKRT